MKSLLLSVFLFITSTLLGSNWQNHWHNGLEFFSSKKFQEASEEFNKAVTQMTKEEKEENPYVIIDRAENSFFLNDLSSSLEDTENAINSNKLTDSERLTCGLRRIAIYSKLGNQEAAIREYNKFVVDCPLLPKFIFLENKIILKNVPECILFKDSMKKFLLEHFCESEENIYEYDTRWVITPTKGCGYLKNEQSSSKGDSSKECCEIHDMRTTDQALGCCNTCSTLAVAANIVCGCVGEVSAYGVICKAACLMFVEALRQACEWCCYNGGLEEKCWKNFETWKDDFSKQNPKCPHPGYSCL